MSIFNEPERSDLAFKKMTLDEQPINTSRTINNIREL